LTVPSAVAAGSRGGLRHEHHLSHLWPARERDIAGSRRLLRSGSRPSWRLQQVYAAGNLQPVAIGSYWAVSADAATPQIKTPTKRADSLLQVMPISVDSLRVFVNQLATRPGMWLGPWVSLSGFAAAITGYEAALRDAGVVHGQPLIGWHFGQWLSARWGVSHEVHWQEHIRERFGQDEIAIAEAAKLIEQWFRAADESEYT